MTDHQKLLIALFGEIDCRAGGEVSVFDVMSMLYELGEERRHIGSCGPSRTMAVGGR